MGSLARPEAKMAHVNLMTDTIIASLPADGLRSIIRAMLTAEPTFTGAFEMQVRKYLQKTSRLAPGQLFDQDQGTGPRVTERFDEVQRRIRSMLGCGLCYQSLPLLGNVVDQSADLEIDGTSPGSERLLDLLVSVDGDIVQALTAVEKTLHVATGVREFTLTEKEVVQGLHNSLLTCREKCGKRGQGFVFERSLALLEGTATNAPNGELKRQAPWLLQLDHEAPTYPPTPSETFQLKGITLPRLFSGLWQLSSPSWGVASQSKIVNAFYTYVSRGLTAFDMADHYGDAEVIFGRFRSSYPHPEALFASTKYCVFQPITVTQEVVRANIAERCQRLRTDKIDLLQFHWQFYDDPQYIKALRLLQEDERIRVLGLCNFDTQHLEHVIESGIKVYSNQVQFSLIDSRPTVKMGKVCEQHNVKLLTYGTLCGGFLADKWLGQAEPELFNTNITPSQRKYLDMILIWGTWSLFQQLLQTLKIIATKHNVTISNVAMRWVLDFPYVGAVIVGARMGVSERSEENLDSYGWRLDEEDQKSIGMVLEKSRRAEMFEAMNDCGGEYR